MAQKQSDLLWVVVKVESGIPVTVEVYRDKQLAEMRERSLRTCMRPDDDEIGLFELQIGCAASGASGIPLL